MPLEVSCGGCKWANAVNTFTWLPIYTHTAATLLLVVDNSNHFRSTSTILRANFSMPASGLPGDATVTGTVATDIDSGSR